MYDFDEKEYNSVVLGALLHDVGKLIHRGTPRYEGKHDVASSDFIKDNVDKLKNLNDLYDIDLVRFLVRHHHSNRRSLTIEQLIKSCNEFYKEKMEYEHNKFFKNSEVEKISEQLLRTIEGENTFLNEAWPVLRR